MSITKRVQKNTLMALAERKECPIEFNGSWAREVGDIKWVRWFILYQRIHRRQIRKNKQKGVETV